MAITSYGLQDIKKEIQHLRPEQIAELCLRLARYKKDNKELLAYILFEADDDRGFIEKIKAETGFMFSQLPVRAYDSAKSLRKILRLLSKYAKFMGSKEAEIELLIAFCNDYVHYIDRKIAYKPLRMLLSRQMLKVRTRIEKLHEDVQTDYTQDYNNMHVEAEKKFPWLY